MSTCRVCEQPEATCGPLADGLCIDCERKVKAGPAPASGPLAIINRAVELNRGADELGKLIALHDAMADRQAREEFQRAMVACQAEMPIVTRDKVNKRTESRYVSLDRINVYARKVYSEHGFYLSFREEPATRPEWIRWVCECGHVAGHRQESAIELPHDGRGPKGEPIGGMNSVQGAVSTSTYAQRVLICRVFNIVIADTDHDGEFYITEEQAAEIERLMKATNRNSVKFMAWALNIDLEECKRKDPKFQLTWADLRNINRADLPKVMAELQRRETGGSQ